MGIYQAIYAIGMLVGSLTYGFLGSGWGLATVFYLVALSVLLIAILAFLPVFPKRATMSLDGRD